MTPISGTTPGYAIATMLQQANWSGLVSGTIPGTTKASTTLPGVVSVLQGISGAGSGISGALYNTAAGTNAVNIFSSLGLAGHIQGILASAEAAKSTSRYPHLGNVVDLTV